ncbi:glycosyltransferase family 2 protein [Leptospira idonii]|uniref:Glycosyltransferase family 2 protein n=1 Tax=Leptospira idonii TaxID=1193500 RepID=A0A4R9LZG0_9LEPT|nr:glycosyltransferase family 2 protein [Leptospira idonii]TGN18309.1 glycosyltransferase family 2 protein [Leptospira idonii]
MSGKRITAIIVTFNPDLSLLNELVSVLICDDIETVIVDNQSSQSFQKSLPVSKLLQFFPLESNFGIGYAINFAIRKYREINDYFIFFDQDSIPEKGMVEKLVRRFEDLEAKGFSPGAIGPQIFDRKYDSKLPFVNPHPVEEGVVEVTHLFTSGTLIKSDLISRIGYLKEDYFIDQVDVEWCLRIRYFGYRVFGDLSAILNHSIGDDLFHLKLLGKKLIRYSPLRNYYMVRNMLVLLRDGRNDFSWRFRNLKDILLRSLYWIVFLDQKWERTLYILKGYRDGILKRMGKYNR